MALVLADRVRETTTTTGTGTVTLAGAYTGFQTFSAGVGNTNSTYYTIASVSLGEWEVGIGTYTTAGNTLSRTTVLASSNAGGLVNFSAGTKDAFVTQPAERALYVASAGTGLESKVTAFTNGGIVYASSTSALFTGSALTFDGTNLGIGTSSPATKLHVFGSGANSRLENSGATTSTQFTVKNTVGTVTLGLDSSTGGGFGVANAAVLWYDAAQPLVFGTSNTERMRLDSSGNLGIGTTSPSTKLTVYDATSPQVTFNNGTSTFIVGNNAGGNNHILYGTGAYPLIFYTNATEGMRLDSSGNLGIGTSSPIAKLDVRGILAVANSGASYWGIDRDDSTGALTFSDSNTTPKLSLDTSGNLGLGVTPSAWNTSQWTALESAYGGALAFYKASNVPVTVLTSNAYYDSSWKYKTTDPALQYEMDGNGGTYKWYQAASGTAGNAITWTQAMTLDSSGNLLVGTTDTGLTTGTGIKLKPAGQNATTPGVSQVGSSSANTENTWHVYSTGAGAYRFYVGYGGTVYATSTTISAISDARFKENIRDLDAGLAKVMALKPRLYDWKEGKGADIKNARGFIAQEFEEVFPDLIDEWKDPAPEGEEPYKSVRQDLIPVLVKAIQEQQAIITQLTARITALEGA